MLHSLASTRDHARFRPAIRTVHRSLVQMVMLGVTTEALLLILFELGLGSLCYLVLLLKPTPKGNIGWSLGYTIFKLLGLCALFAVNLGPTGFFRLPLLAGLLLNEIILLVASLRNREQLNSIMIRSMYNPVLLSARVFGELAILLSFGVISLAAQFIPCDCKMERDPTLVHLVGDNPSADICLWPRHYEIVANVFRPQLRGFALAVIVTASTVSVSGWKFMLRGFHNDIKNIESDNVTVTLRDAQWKKTVRTVFSYFTFLNIVLFGVSFFSPGFGTCIRTQTITGVTALRYTLSPTSNSFLNALLAISQMFVADIHVRLAAVKEVEELDVRSDENENMKWTERAESALVRRKTYVVMDP